MHLVPAYGRDYKSAKAVKEDWANDKDFIICDISSPDDGRAINLKDAHTGTYYIRYNKLTKVCVVQKV